MNIFLLYNCFFFSGYQDIFLFNQNNLHSIRNIFTIYIFLIEQKYFFIKSLFFSCYQGIFLFNRNNFAFNEKYFYHIYFFNSRKIFFYYVNFSFITFLVSISGFPFVFTKVRILHSACKLSSSTGIQKSCKEGY